MNLNSVFDSVAYKILTQVDLPERGSNQHEINGVAALKQLFSTTERISGEIKWHFFSDNSDPQNSTGQFTFYDARLKSSERTGRTEWRMYYSGEFIEKANPGDILILALSTELGLHGLIFQENSGWLRAAKSLFGIEIIQPNLQVLSEDFLAGQELEFSKEQLLQELGIEIEIPISAAIDEIAIRELNLAHENNKDFPTTKRMSELGRENIDFDISRSDETLLIWLEHEEKIFRAIEKIIVQQKLTTGFDSVDDFIEYSISIHNRRKSRMGYALQNHLAYLFSQYDLKYEAQAKTEGKNKPDFLFPGQSEYLNPEFDESLLIMLGVKSSCKERWRQILTEANRISHKHLLTLEQAISKDQTDEMVGQNVQLILPAQYHFSYSIDQRNSIWTVNQFIEFVKLKQND